MHFLYVFYDEFVTRSKDTQKTNYSRKVEKKWNVNNRWPDYCLQISLMKKIIKLRRQFPTRSGKRYPSSKHSTDLPSADGELIIKREPPGKGFHHFLTRKHVSNFIRLLPQYPDIIKGIDYILLARGEHGCDGWYDGKVIAINAWEQDCWRSLPADYYADHREVLSRLRVEAVKIGQNYMCKFNPSSIRAFQLFHILLHELGHHHDKMSTRSQQTVSRGEKFAENYACCYENLIWQRYTGKDVYKVV